MAGRKRVRNPASQEMILAAAERVVARRGPAHLTLDAVAAEAGLSKGGLLYNFPSKQALIEGMILAFIARHRQHVERLRGTEGCCGRARAGIRLILAAKKDLPIDRGTGLAILAGLAENPELLAPLRAEVDAAMREVRENAEDPLKAMLVWLAADGLEFWNLLGISPLDEAGKAEIEAYMCGLVGAQDDTPAAEARSTDS